MAAAKSVLGVVLHASRPSHAGAKLYASLTNAWLCLPSAHVRAALYANGRTIAGGVLQANSRIDANGGLSASGTVALGSTTIQDLAVNGPTTITRTTTGTALTVTAAAGQRCTKWLW